MKAPILLALAALWIVPAQAAEPTGTLTLACKGTETRRHEDGSAVDQINIGIVLDFQKKTVVGLSDSLLRITSLTETTVSFDGAEPSWNMNGTLDRVTGSLVAASTKSDYTKKIVLTLTYDLQCRPTQRMF
jgi:hypothetical protein